MTSERRFPTRVGSLRPSALIHTFGVGSVVDLPRMSVVVMGLDEWSLDHAPTIDERRLLDAVRRLPALAQVERLHGPPQTEDLGNLSFGILDEARRIGVPVAAFPRWLLCPVCRKLAPLESNLFEPKRNPVIPDRNEFVHRNCQKARTPPRALPARFVVACEHGHLDDFPWVEFVHRKDSLDEVECEWNLRLDEIDVSGEVAAIQIQCTTCDERRRLSEAFGEQNRAGMPRCRGTHPHLRERSGCELRMRPMLLGASNTWFPVSRSALSLPRATDELGDLVEQNWTVLAQVTSQEVLGAFRAVGQLDAFKGVSDESLLAAIEARREAAGEQGSEDLKLGEWEVLTAAVLPRRGELTARPQDPPSGYEPWIERVVLVERLREVQALVGFTRIESPHDEQDPGKIVKLARSAPEWLPAAETRGEGIFIELREEAVRDWVERNQEREQEFLASQVAWSARRGIPNAEASFPGIRLVLVHSLAHALMRRLVLESGYSQASIRERIYAREPDVEGGPMAGFLLYTATSDSEGTLGGLVALGEAEETHHHLDGALRDVELCASDPLCAEHSPDSYGTALHGAACHACLFAPETSCELGNRYLDRAVLTPLVTGAQIGLFSSRVAP